MRFATAPGFFYGCGSRRARIPASRPKHGACSPNWPSEATPSHPCPRARAGRWLLEELCAGGELPRPGFVGCSLRGRSRKHRGCLAPRSAPSRAGLAAPFLLSRSSSSFQKETKTNSGPEVAFLEDTRVSADPDCCLVPVSEPLVEDAHSQPRGQHAPEAQPSRHLHTILGSKHTFFSTDSLLSRKESVLRGRGAHPPPGCF